MEASEPVDAAVGHVGCLEVVALLDAAGRFPEPAEVAFPNARPRDWYAAHAADPAALDSGGGWHLAFRCFAIRGPSARVILVDAGVGPEGSLAASWAPVPGRLPAALAEVGIGPADVDTVVLTHLHSDHTGWSVVDGAPMFPSARYVVQDAEIAGLRDNGGGAIWEAVVAPLAQSGQLDEVAGSVQLAAAPTGERVTVLPTPGHTVGHQSVVVDGPATQMIVTGDVLVHAVQLVAPGVRYAYENDAELARQTRVGLLAAAGERDAWLATAHLGRAFVKASSDVVHSAFPTPLRDPPHER